jgi:phosphoglycolate phosphatase
MDIKHIVWDWNGTLLNDKNLAVSAINVLLKKYELKEIDHEEYLEIFSFPVIDYYRRLGFDFDKTPFTVVGSEFIEEYTARMYDVKMHDSAKEVLQYIDNSEASQSLLSAAKQQMLDILMKHHHIEKYFERVVGLDNHYANSKLDVGKQWIEELGLPKSQILFVGDTIHDVEVAKELGANCVLIANGHAPFARLEASGERVFHNIIDFKNWFSTL